MDKEKKRILVVDDLAVNRKIIRKILQNEYEVLEADNGQHALQVVEEDPSLCTMLLDLVMPQMDGYSVLKELQRRGSDLPVIVLTSNTDSSTEQAVLDMGAVDFVTKPVDTRILKSRVRNAVARSQIELMHQLQYIADHDPLTGLWNRSRFFRETRLTLDKNPNIEFAGLRLDVDNFRLYNSIMGEEEGNHLLRHMANCIVNALSDKPHCIYSHIDADVFDLIVPYDKEELIKLAAQLQTAIAAYRDDYAIAISIGAYHITDSTSTPESICAYASIASDRCKNIFDTTISFYDESLGNALRQQQEIVTDMVPALAQHQFQVYLQPKYDLRLGVPCGAEALVRWFHPTKGMISPGAFIPVFESNGFIAQLDRFMWESVCALLKKWQDNGKKVYPISVNMSRISLYNPHVPEILHDLVEKYKIAPSLLQLEVTESAYMSSPERLKTTVRTLHEMGFTILMDDFGSGYSSLNTLKEISMDILKIDMKFMPTKDDTDKSEKILSSVVRMAAWLGMPVIAEGVETSEQRDFLQSIGCGYVQGFFYARPMPVADYETLIASSVAPSETLKKEISSGDSSWITGPDMERILSGIMMPVAIFEYSPKSLEVVRANQPFQDQYGFSGDNGLVRNLAHEDELRVVEAFENACSTGTPTEVEFAIHRKADSDLWLRMKLQLMEHTPQSSLLCAIIMDVTTERLYESRLQSIVSASATPVGKPKMLVVDDQELSRDLLRTMFEKDYTICDAGNGQEALDKLHGDCADAQVILLDMVMPVMDGAAFLAIKNKSPEIASIPVIIISAENNAEQQLNMLRLGVNDYITKPFAPEITRQRVKNVLAYNSRFQDLMREYQSLLKRDSERHT